MKHVSHIWSDWNASGTLVEVPILRTFASLSPIWLVLTFALSAFHQWQMIKTTTQMTVHHDSMHVIVALPMVYGIMSFWSQFHVWQLAVYGAEKSVLVFGDFAGTEEAFSLASEAAMGMADAYEALAIWLFAQLTLKVADYHAMTVTHSVTGTPQARLSRSRTLEERIDTAQEEVTHLVKTREAVVLLGIRYFCFVCGLKAIIAEAPVLMFDIFGGKGQKWFLEHIMTAGTRSYMGTYCSGMGMVTSFIAIENIIVLERNHEHALESQQFNTFKKFLSAKVLVSLVFMQDMILTIPPISSYTPSQQTLFMSSLLCLECFLLTILHYYAWDVKETWAQKLHIMEQEDIGQSSRIHPVDMEPLLKNEAVA